MDSAESITELFKQQLKDNEKIGINYKPYEEIFALNIKISKRIMSLLELALLRYARGFRTVKIDNCQDESLIIDIICKCMYNLYENMANITSIRLDLAALQKLQIVDAINALCHKKDKQQVVIVMNIENIYRLSLGLHNSDLLYDSMNEEEYKRVVRISACLPKTYGEI